MELQDSEMSSPGAGPSKLPAPTTTTAHMDLVGRCKAMLADLGIEDRARAAASPLILPDTLLDFAFPSTEDGGDISQLLIDLSALLEQPGCSDAMVIHFGPVCLDLLARWLSNPATTELQWQQRLGILASYALVTPHMWSLILTFLQSSPLAHSPFGSLGSSDLLTCDVKRLQQILLAYLRLLICDPDLAHRNGWSLQPLYVLRKDHPDAGVRLLAVSILSRLRNWSEVKRMRIERECMGSTDVSAMITYGWRIVSTEGGRSELREESVDCWVLALKEAERNERLRQRMRNHTRDPSVDLSSLIPHFTPLIVTVGRTLLLRSAATSSDFLHVQTAPSTDAMAAMLGPFVAGRPVLLSGPASSGKSHLVRHLSALTHPSQPPFRRILTISLADTSIDVKSLVGSYVSSPTQPGTFEWMEGALTKALRAGRWVVFDDIDRASTEMLVLIASLARSMRETRPGHRATLAVPGRDPVKAAHSFALFATRKVFVDAFHPPAFFGHHLFQEAVVHAPAEPDILNILSARYPVLPDIILQRLVNGWMEIRNHLVKKQTGKTREAGMRDIEKWCARTERRLPTHSAGLDGDTVLSNPAFQESVFLEAVDLFFAAYDPKARSVTSDQALQGLARTLRMDEEHATSLLIKRRPQFELSTEHLFIGRLSIPLPRSQRKTPSSESRPFALTRPSLILLEQIAAAVTMGEAALLVGETGTGKTTAVQHLALTCGKTLTALNLSNQTETSDLLGGFKPIDAGVIARALHSRWQSLFCETFSMAKPQNGAYIEAASKAMNGKKWPRLSELWRSSAVRAVDKLTREEAPTIRAGSPRKRRKVNGRVAKAAESWRQILREIEDFTLHHVKSNSRLVFQFEEGPLVKALTHGDWILLDEVNLASQETLESLSTLLEGPTSSLILTDRGDMEPVTRHPDFRLFACMNPATDVGKKDLPPSLRNSFTEIYVPPPDENREALVTIVEQYLGDSTAGDRSIVLDVADLFSEFKRLSVEKVIVDGSNTAPHYSMRTLARALTFAVESSPTFGLRRALWEGWLMSFTMSLDLPSVDIARKLCEKHILGPMKNARATLSQVPTLPSHLDADEYVRFGSFWLKRGPLPPAEENRYVMTPSVQAKLSDLARVILTRKYPVLIQGPTSSGKTSAIEFLAHQTGHRFVRINNHEHTDIQEYLGTYVTDPQSGNLIFQEGLLVTAVRQGHWIVLDELNLAPTDVLEALNRLLDDNRELVIPETQEVIRPHPNFMLFATQNPPGLYAGRKILSRAFRNRFLEVHFDDVPRDELETILCQRCQIAPSYARKIVEVFEELRHRRQATRVFESKQSFATLRDLFRWAERGAVGYQHLAEDGYMLLAERARQKDDKLVIKSVIEDIMKVTVAESSMYYGALPQRLPFDQLPDSTIVWTRAMKRLFTLVAVALAHNEPVLLVGETGCGKTSVCDVIAKAFQQTVIGVNCHQNMETADLIGGQRPVRNRNERRARVMSTLNQYTSISPDVTDDSLLSTCDNLSKRDDVDKETLRACREEIRAMSALFEWSNGPLVQAMSVGELLLLDEVSLADDSVLERLNSVLEPGRTLVLAEKGVTDIEAATIVANPGFHVVATMNPGGDFGKKELSPALRNRFTEIWVPPLEDRQDLLEIIQHSWSDPSLHPCGLPILDFFDWFKSKTGDSGGLGLRDILAWVNFVDLMSVKQGMSASSAFVHAGQMTIVDGLETLPQLSGLSRDSILDLRQQCVKRLDVLARGLGSYEVTSSCDLQIGTETLVIGDFTLPLGSADSRPDQFRFQTPTTILNAMRVLRACQLPKAILLEGSPGVGKTSLISALAAVSRHRLQRINLSDQTDLIDLFGADLPVDGGAAGEFQWRDAAFLQAMQRGDWVLLDEMNLASQSILEGLNAVLDHRGTVFIPELNRSFDRHPDFRIFAAQNPHHQGGGRKGLPKSFLNRFSKVYLQEQTSEDLQIICRDLFAVPQETTQRMIAFNEQVRMGTMVNRTIGREGSPWEFNLRDLFRWFELLLTRNGLERSFDPVEFLRMVYLHRFRNEQDRRIVASIFSDTFHQSIDWIRPSSFLTPMYSQIGHSVLLRDIESGFSDSAPLDNAHLDVAESLLKALELGWLVILPGSTGVGKRSLIRSIAVSAGKSLSEFEMHPGVDASEILGTFEQQDTNRLVRDIYTNLRGYLTLAADDDLTWCGKLEAIDGIHHRCSKDLTEDNLQAFIDMARQIINSLQTTYDVHPTATLLDRLASLGSQSKGFTWVDGGLITALRSGGWFLISEANLCSASVLDRLNSLCERNGVLALNEKGSIGGQPEIITPHKDFRLFMTYDPKYGELSRAMRNRGVELYVDASAPHGGIARETSEADSELEGHSVLQSIHRFGTPDKSGPSVIANELSFQSLHGLDILRRLEGDDQLQRQALVWLSSPTMTGEIKATLTDVSSTQNLPLSFCEYLPIDVSLNPNIRVEHPGALFRLVQVSLRFQTLARELRGILADPSYRSSILAKSASRSNRPVQRVIEAWTPIYPYLESITRPLPDSVARLIGDRSLKTALVTSLEDLYLYGLLILKKAKSASFNYSAVSLLATWTKEAITPVPALREAVVDVDNLVAVTQKTSGFGQDEIWAMFRSDGQTPSMDVDGLDHLVDTELRMSVLEALSSSEVDDVQLDQLLRDVPSRQDPLKTGTDEKWDNWAILSLLEMSAVAHIAQRFTTDALKILASDARLPLSSLVPLKHSQVSPGAEPASYFKSTSMSLGRLFSSGAGLFRPNLLTSVHRFNDESVPMIGVPEHDTALKVTTQAVLWSAQSHPVPRQDLLDVGIHVLGHLVSAFGYPYPINTAADLLDRLESLVATAPAYLRKSVESDIQPALLAVVHQRNNLHSIGLLYLAISRVIINLYVTNIPIDPAARQLLQIEVFAARIALLDEELAAVSAGENALKGVADSKRLETVKNRLEAVQDEQAKLGPTIDRPSDPVRLAALFHEIHGFLGDTLDRDMIHQLVQTLQENLDHGSRMEDNFQLASSAFLQRLTANYPDVVDLVAPVESAILFAKMGIHCVKRHAELSTPVDNVVIQAMLSFPSCERSRLIFDTPKGLTPQLKLFRLANGSGTIQQPTSASLNAWHFVELANDVYQAWSDVRLREQREAQEAESLYRVKKTDMEVMSDVELEEKEFGELFPSYEGVGDEGKTSDTSPTKVRDNAKFGSDLVLAFHQILSTALRGSDDAGDKGNLFYSILSTTFNPSSFSEDLDSTSLAFQINQLYQRHRSMGYSSDSPNFYLSPNEPEIRKAYNLLFRLLKRLDDLVSDWPEQMVLQHVRDRVDRILQLHLGSPVAQILTALEGLLTHTDDWEPFAHRENSLETYRGEISSLIISWRKLELSSWNRLLDDTEKQYVRGDAEWTLRLFGALVQGSIGSLDIDAHVTELLPMLQTYLTNTTLGLYPHRLATLKGLQELVSLLANSCCKDADQKKTMARIAILLDNVVAGAALFAPRIDASLAAQRKVIDKSVKDFIKLASWKDVNVYALKASAVKSHRQLYRSIRKYKDVLQQPLAPILSDYNSVCTQVSSTSAPFALATPSSAVEGPSRDVLTARSSVRLELPKHLADLDTTFERYIQVVNSRTNLDDKASETAEQLSTDIIETSFGLAKATPSTLTKENKKLVQNLASRKRKAFSDLLKTLRSLGFSPNVRADILQHQQSTIWLASRDPLTAIKSSPAISHWSDKVRDYHARLGILMPALRASLAHHSDEIVTTDLQRGIGFTESLYAVSLIQRDKVSTQLRNVERLHDLVARMNTLSRAEAVSGGPVAQKSMVSMELHLRDLEGALLEIDKSVSELRSLQGQSASDEWQRRMVDMRAEVGPLVALLSEINAASRSSGVNLFTDTEMASLQQAHRLSSSIAVECLNIADQNPDLLHLFGPVAHVAQRGSPASTFAGQYSAIPTDTWKQSDDLIQIMLAVAQKLPSSSLSEVEGETKQVPTSLEKISGLSTSLRLDEVTTRIHQLLTAVDGVNKSTEVPQLIARVLPFCAVISQASLVTATQQLQALKSVYKLTFVTGRIMLDLAQKGFCKPQEESKDDGGEEGEETVEGTGMGAGTGDKNVSSEITQESQVEGLRDEVEEEEEEKDGEEADGDDDAVSMDEDFEGDMGEGREKEEAEGSGDEDEEDHDETVDNVDPLEPGAVDEKFWEGNEEEKAEKAGDEQVDGKQQQQGESEMTAKEEKDGGKEQKEAQEATESKNETKENVGEDQSEQEDTAQDLKMEQDEDEQEDTDGEAAEQTQDQVDVPEGDALDLPDDLALEDTQKEAQDEGDDITLSGDEGLDDDQMSVDDDVENGDADKEDMEGEDGQDGPEATGAPEEDAENNEAEAGMQDLDVDVAASNEPQGQEVDAGAGQGGATNDEEVKGESKDVEMPEDGEDGVEENRPAGKGAAPQQPQGRSQEQDGSDGAIDSSGAPLPADTNQAQQQSRSLGDIMKDIRRRRDEILAQQERDAQPQPQTSADETPQGTSDQKEYLKDGDEGEEQALGPAGEEERQKLADLNILDEEEGDDKAPPGPEDSEDLDETSDDRKDAVDRMDTIKTQQTESQGPVEKALTQADVQSGLVNPDGTQDESMDLERLPDSTQPAEEALLDEELDEVNDVIELRDHQDQADSAISGQDTWRLYASLTSDLSYALCEQLRLILEPTLATRLQGDFRTGKRLNMRKIIPYIASEYTKDKIWLRRTKPSKREYQVLLSLDDSRSMAESHSIHLAHQTLALVCQALTKLEVGQVSVCKFGQGVDILHPFGEVFSDLDGARVMQAFKFDQHRTDMVALVERTLAYMSEGREKQNTPGSADLWQLEIIISDGVCQDHDKLRVLLRRAMEERVMIVFIVIDSLNQQPQQTQQTQQPSGSATTPAAPPSGASRPSILSMQSVEYKMVNGEMQLEMTRYLDTFPFEFFVVLRDVEALPGVLADTLRQWMARVSQSQE